MRKMHDNMSMIKRLINIPKTQSFFLFGPRGSGKSTLLRQLFKVTDCLWVDLLDQKTEFELSQNPDSLLEKWKSGTPSWVIIDEVQKIPSLLDVVHRGIEAHKIKFALTGSSSRKLKKGGANLLANRTASFFLSPFCSLELGKDFNLQKALAHGLLPRFWDEKSLSAQDIQRALYSYVQTYLKEEVAAEQLVRNLDPFRRFLVCAAQSSGKIVSYAKIERDAGVTHSQAERHFEILCDTLIGRYLEPYDQSIRKRQSKKSKFYFFDTGVVRALTNLLEETLSPATYEFGDLFETFIINEFHKLAEANEKRWRFSYLRTQSEVEIDLIVEKPRGAPILIEIKSSKKIKQEQIEQFAQISKSLKASQKYILSNDTSNREVKNIRCLPWQQGLKEIFDL